MKRHNLILAILFLMSSMLYAQPTTSIQEHVHTKTDGSSLESYRTVVDGCDDDHDALNCIYKILVDDGDGNYANDNSLLEMDFNGSIGIGVSSPNAKLHVNGNIIGDKLDLKEYITEYTAPQNGYHFKDKINIGIGGSNNSIILKKDHDLHADGDNNSTNEDDFSLEIFSDKLLIISTELGVPWQTEISSQNIVSSNISIPEYSTEYPEVPDNSSGYHYKDKINIGIDGINHSLKMIYNHDLHLDLTNALQDQNTYEMELSHNKLLLKSTDAGGDLTEITSKKIVSPNLDVRSPDMIVNQGEILGKMTFNGFDDGDDNSTSEPTEYASITAIADGIFNGGQVATRLSFVTRLNEYDPITPSMDIHSSGDVSIYNKLDVSGDFSAANIKGVGSFTSNHSGETNTNITLGYEQDPSNTNYYRPVLHLYQNATPNGIASPVIKFTDVAGDYEIKWSGASNELQMNGNVGVIGTLEADKIKTGAWEIAAVNPPDYVFEEDYDLKSLEEVERYIKKNKHLPNVPSGKEMEKSVDMVKLNFKLLEKIEELTLHTIEQEKRIKRLEAKIR